MIEGLFDHISKFVPLEEREKNDVERSFRLYRLKKREHLVSVTDTFDDLFFVCQGCCRLYYLDEIGNEKTLQFGLPGWWLGNQFGSPNRHSNAFALQAVEDSVVARIGPEDFEALLDRVPALERYFRKIFQRAAFASQHRIYLTQNQNAEELYRNFAAKHGEFLQRVPQYMLASFLGFTPEFLSKIRAAK